MLLGTYNRGLRLFNGSAFQPFPGSERIAGNARVNGLVAAGDGMFVAAVQGRGLVFFDRDGRIRQVLGRQLDHRISRIAKLVSGPGGMLWGLADDGVIRVEFPARFSRFDRLLGSAAHFARVYRWEGRLWMMSDGVVYRAGYDEAGCLIELRPDSPVDRFAFSFSTAPGGPTVGTQSGAFYRAPGGWVDIAPGTVNLRVVASLDDGGRCFFVAQGEAGWLARGVDGVPVMRERYEIPDFPTSYAVFVDRDGVGWVELGHAGVARIEFGGERPEIVVYGPASGLGEGWPQIFSLDGTARFNVLGRILEFDAEADRCVAKAGGAPGVPDGRSIAGRPGRDARGRVWFEEEGNVRVSPPDAGTGSITDEERIPAGLRGAFFAFQEDGVVWIHSEGRLLRYDPELPGGSRPRLRAMISHVSLVNSRRTVFPTGGPLDLEYSDRSIVAHLSALGDSLDAPVEFEAKLEGSDRDWVAIGQSGVVSFNDLSSGDQVLRVRPRIGGSVGEEGSWRIHVRVPWHRSRWTYAAAAGGLVALVGGGVWVGRRQKLALARLVDLRTRELRDSSKRLARQVEEIRLLSQAIEQSPVAVIITESSGRMVYASSRLCEMTGYTAPELIGKSVDLLRADGLPADVAREIDVQLAQGGSWRGELTNRHKHGRLLPVRATISALRATPGTAALRLHLEEDISQWVEEQLARKKLEAQLLQSQKLESLGTLAGGIAHDFNNILTGLLGYNELARVAADGSREMAELLEHVHRAGLRAKDLVAQILTFSRRAPPRLVPLNLAGPVGEAARLLRASTPSTIEIGIALEDGGVRADATQIQQVVLNLGANAAQAMKHRHGAISISLQRMEADAGLAAEMQLGAPAAVMCLRVRDNGAGIPPDIVDRIFDPFFTTKAPGEGTGLGLAIVRGIVTNHHGVCRVRSEPGRGSLFEVFFPICTDPAVPAPEIPRVEPGAGREILVVDDESAVVEFVTRSLRGHDYVVTAFADPREALACCAQNSRRFAGMVTDLTMPHLTGIELIRRVRESGILLPAVIITGYDHTDEIARLERCKVVRKPFSGEELARVLGSVLGS